MLGQQYYVLNEGQVDQIRNPYLFSSLVTGSHVSPTFRSEAVLEDPERCGSETLEIP